MQLHYDKQIHNNIISIALYTENFTTQELLAIDQFGEPLVTLDKTYGKYQVKISAKINTGFKMTVTFDGAVDTISAAADAANLFITDIKIALATAMKPLLDEQTDITTKFSVSSGDATIDYTTANTTTTTTITTNPTV